MPNTNKTEIIIVHSKNTEKEASLLNQLISSNSNDIISGVYTAKQYEDTKHTLSSDDYIVFIGYDKVIRKLTNSIPATYHMYGMQYGWIGKQAHLWLDEAAQSLPVTSSSFDKYYEDKVNALKNGMQAPGILENIMSYFEAFVPFLGVAKIKERRYTCLVVTFFLEGLPLFIK